VIGWHHNPWVHDYPVHNLSSWDQLQSSCVLSAATPTRRLRTPARFWALVIGGVAVLGACRAPPLTDTDERSPYDRYDAVRNQRAEAYTEDKFGNKVPNLRGRLLPHD
jgi:hypothetical protein